ncbi:MAG: hypothetical protein PWR03_2354 [Tenuifilum sp.]|uniref:OmpA family protein n=1 Tax=Tenuifilum sp. TaxID=2760880 RepID=UPI0024AA8A20|nr:OmpA family protein [Tenuifilum sp.]MDI3528170.1 hypothetical protein [Tenuifilum sp.]
MARCQLNIFYKTIIIVFSSIFTTLKVNAQYFYYDQVPPKIDVSFAKHSLESGSRNIIFNVVKIKNQLGRQETITLNITVPQGWRILGQEKMELTLSPYDSISIPLRIAVGSAVKGDIGYSIIASITDINGNTIKNEYSYVKIPRLVDLSFKVLSKIVYLDPITLNSEIKVEIRNRGNREEPVSLIFDGMNSIGIGKQEQTRYLNDYVIQPFSDSVLTFPIKLLNQTLQTKVNYLVDLSTRTTDTITKTSIWVRKLNTSYENYISPRDKLLTIALTAQGLLDDTRKTNYIANIEGKTLLKGNNDIYYYYRNFSSKNTSDLWKNNRMYLGTNIGKLKLEVGDNYRSLESNTFGRGGFIEYKGQKLNFQMIANENKQASIQNFGGIYKFLFSQTNFLQSGIVYSNNPESDFKSLIGLAGGGFSLNEHTFSGYFAFNQLSFNNLNSDNNIKNDHAIIFKYSSRFKKMSNNLIFEQRGPFFYHSQAGRTRIQFNSIYQFNSNLRIYNQYFETQQVGKHTINYSDNNNATNISRSGRVEIQYQASKNLQIFLAPAFDNYLLKNYATIPTDEYFSTFSFKVQMGTRVKNASNTTFFTPRFEFARVNVLHNPFLNSKSNFNFQQFSLNFRSPYFSIIAFYNSGPRSSIDQLGYVQNSKQTRRLMLLPTFNGFLIKDQLEGSLGISYSNDLIAKSSYSNIVGQLNWFLPKNWEIHALCVYTIQNRTTPQETVERYHNLYAEAGIRKEFGFDQPRIKYHNIDLVFYKDFNGNHVQDENEPGIKNVLVTLSRTSTNTSGYIPGDVYMLELISDNFGHVSIENLPEGRYDIDYTPLGSEIGTFSKAITDLEFNVNRDGAFYIPFVEKNKVFGRIILNRSKLSGLGKVDVSNIRITATDSKGNMYSTLTDKNGEFTIYAPVTDEYIVTINNIFYENFDLRQNNFRVQFNGYKQFEVNFVFDEKVRRINFSPSSQDLANESVLQVRRTNLRGTIKDASSLKPLRARVNLINTKNNSIVASIYSNPLTGDYNLSFLAGENYALEVVADDYWYYSETLNLNQVTTFMNVTRDILLKPISIGSKLELNIRFDINKADLGPEAVAELNRLLDILRQNPGIKIEVQGHSDDLEAINNQTISEERAKRVAQYLIENGFSNLQVRGFGNTVPIAPNDTEENRALNRRVEIEVIGK